MNLTETLQKKSVFMGHVYYGSPSEAECIQFIQELESKLDILEFGIPFSDPTSDGPVFQKACTRALANGVTPEKCFQAIEQLKKGNFSKPIVLTTYYNIIYKMGLKSFVQRAQQAGVEALIVPNLSLEDSEELRSLCEQNQIALIYLIAPNTPEPRIKKICEAARSFIYVLNAEGVTGAQTHATKLSSLLKTICKHTSLPLLVGFGISTPEQVQNVLDAGADGYIIGSALPQFVLQGLPLTTLKYENQHEHNYYA